MADWLWRDVFAVHRHASFDPHVALLDVVLRGAAIDLALFALLRVTRLHSGAMGMPDVPVIVLIADAVQNGISGASRSITEELALARTLVRDGKVVHRTLRRELMTEAELMAPLRLRGLDEVGDVARARVEDNGEVSVRRR